MTTEIVTVTPYMAKEWLNFNKCNRSLRRTKILQYAHDMKNGKWNLTGQGITFGKDGRLLDGQHRLYAIVFSNVPVKFLVVRDADVVGTYDCGIQRTTADQFKLASEMNTGNMYTTNGLAVVKLCYQIEHTGSVSKHNAPTTSDLELYIADNKEELNWAVRLMEVGRSSEPGVTRGLRRGVIGATLYAVHKLNIGFTKENAERFARILRSGLSEHNTDAPIIALRNKLITLSAGSDVINRECFLRIQYAINQYMKGSTSLRSYFPDKNVFDFTTLYK